METSLNIRIVTSLTVIALAAMVLTGGAVIVHADTGLIVALAGTVGGCVGALATALTGKTHGPTTGPVTGDNPVINKPPDGGEGKGGGNS